MKLTTIAELGQQLPIGKVDGDKLIKTFDLRPYKSKIDRFMNIWNEANEGQHIAKGVAKFLSLLVSQYADEALALDSEGDSTADTMAKVLNWSFADVMYIYIMIRISVSELMEVNYSCPECQHKGLVKLDLKSTEVMVFEKPADLYTAVKLKHGFKLATGKICKSLVLQPIPFKTLLLSGATQGNTDSLGYNQLREAVYKLGGAEQGYVVSDEELDEMSKIDQLIVDRYAGKATAGPKMRTVFECESQVDRGGEKQKCGHKITNALNWSFDDFFGSSIPLGELMI